MDGGSPNDALDKVVLSSITEIPDPRLPYTPLASHTLLAACQRDELAYEAPLSTVTDDHYCGVFTTLLLDLLRQPGRNLFETTYIGLFHTLQRTENKSRSPKQTPYVEGDNKTRILFSTTDVGHQFPVSPMENGKFSVRAGTIHGVDTETEFTVTSGEMRFEGLKPIHVFPLCCTFEKLNGMSDLKDDSRADITKWNQLHPKMNPVGQSLKYLSKYFLISPSRDGRMKLERRDKLIPQYAERDIHFTLREACLDLSTPDTHASAIINAVNHFNFHLLQSESNYKGNQMHIKVKLERLSTSGGLGQPVKDGEDFFASGEPLRPKANIEDGPTIAAAVKIVDLKSLYSFTLSLDNLGTSLYPYIFGFDPATYQIASFYHPQAMKEGPLRADRPVTIGYGPEGGEAIEFQSNEVTFFKIFVTSTYVDLSDLVQDSPFEDDAGRIPQKRTIPNDFWDSWIYIPSDLEERITFILPGLVQVSPHPLNVIKFQVRSSPDVPRVSLAPISVGSFREYSNYGEGLKRHIPTSKTLVVQQILLVSFE
ncbi:hypothetical protein BYT27DRAFT_7332684 [Phlegmacium glaucopus]|nr:hypothetical protein BYT27DRAFT_7332684 [Phlegmacium glaucopus]